MVYREDIKEEFDNLKCCVLIPSYNNSPFLEEVINGVKDYTDNIIVVNDGSTDDTQSILKSIKDIEVLRFTKNKGKGIALREGFKFAHKLGFKYAITIDSDGQHLPEDLPKFIKKIKECPGSLIVGARNMDQDNIPGKSSFGHKFSNFWFRFETGIKLPDTQSGYRLYPLEPISKMKFFTSKYEFEIEVIVKAAWKRIPISWVPVKVRYFEGEKRISHFRPFRDFSRVSLLNTYLVTLAIIYYRAYLFIKSMSWKKVTQFVKNDLMMSKDSNFKLAASVFIGIFMGIVPVWGWQLAIAIFLAIIMKLNKTIVIITANISIPPMIPLILYLSFITGGIVLGTGTSFNYSSEISFDIIKDDIIQYIVGALVFGVLLATVMGLLTYLGLLIFRKRKIQEEGVIAK